MGLGEAVQPGVTLDFSQALAAAVGVHLVEDPVAHRTTALAARRAFRFEGCRNRHSGGIRLVCARRQCGSAKQPEQTGACMCFHGDSAHAYLKISPDCKEILKIRKMFLIFTNGETRRHGLPGWGESGIKGFVHE
jgi:hypothetical protein